VSDHCDRESGPVNGAREPAAVKFDAVARTVRGERRRVLLFGAGIIAGVAALDLLVHGAGVARAAIWSAWAASLAAAGGLVTRGPRWGPTILGIIAGEASIAALMALAWIGGGSASPYFIMAVLIPALIALVVPESMVQPTVVGVTALFAAAAIMTIEGRTLRDVALLIIMLGGSSSFGLLSFLRAQRRREQALRFEHEQSREVQRLAESEALLREEDRRRNHFLAILSHELRNPLAPIRNGLHLLDRAPPGSEQAARATKVINRQVDQLARLVDDLLDLTRISRGKITLDRSRIDLRDLARQACEDHRTVFDARGVRLHVAVPDDPALIHADAARMTQVIGNLLQNAAKFTPAGGSTSVTVAAANGRAEIRVRDDGIGIEPEFLGRVFEPFAQAESGREKTHGGLGLGLALVKGLVELHGGAVVAMSPGANRGSEFVVGLPLATDRAADDVASARARTGISSRVILVVEDDPDSGQMLADVLALDGHRVHLAADGRSGIAKALEVKPDIVLCDIGLPDMSGYEVARTLRGDASLERTYLVALSGYAQPEDRQRALEAGFDAHLGKPASPEMLNEVMARTRR
jgi:two-component system CheB/CheR fusion protein